MLTWPRQTEGVCIPCVCHTMESISRRSASGAFDLPLACKAAVVQGE